MDRTRDWERTIAYAEAAIGQLKANRIPANPRNYELWYTYSAGFNKQLNDSIDKLLSKNGRITVEECSELYGRCLSPLNLGERIDEVGDKIADEIDRVMAMIKTNSSSTSVYGASLEGASEALGDTQDSEQIRSIVETLLAATKSVDSDNKTLEAQLVESRRQIDTLQENLESVRFESMTDELTSLANRKHFQRALEQALSDSRINCEPTSLLMIDIDYFKLFNDTYGHQTGDQVLRLVASAIRQSVGKNAIPARYGGEEFAVVLPRAQLTAALALAEDIRAAVVNKDLIRRSTGEPLGRITISIGCAEWQESDTVDALIARADACLYTAKRRGRNRVSVEYGAAPEIARNVA